MLRKATDTLWVAWVLFCHIDILLLGVPWPWVRRGCEDMPTLGEFFTVCKQVYQAPDVCNPMALQDRVIAQRKARKGQK